MHLSDHADVDKEPSEKDVISVENLRSPFEIEIPEEGLSLFGLEKQVIKQALDKAENNQTKASKLLRISRDTLRYKIKKYNL
ncbi:MAG: helix-turn-helix domain-containing protein [Bacteroidetes bacterium]|nr:helix-turn-helix domain-containing protein [Bacteroidota bacterium]